jgi:uncharacterized membrane protein YhaH (DUF805 family)
MKIYPIRPKPAFQFNARINTLLFLAFALVLLIAGVTFFSYIWAYTDTTFGGLVGFLALPSLAIMCFLLGYVYRVIDAD